MRKVGRYPSVFHRRSLGLTSQLSRSEMSSTHRIRRCSVASGSRILRSLCQSQICLQRWRSSWCLPCWTPLQVMHSYIEDVQHHSSPVVGSYRSQKRFYFLCLLLQVASLRRTFGTNSAALHAQEGSEWSSCLC